MHAFVEPFDNTHSELSVQLCGHKQSRCVTIPKAPGTLANHPLICSFIHSWIQPKHLLCSRYHEWNGPHNPHSLWHDRDMLPPGWQMDQEEEIPAGLELTLCYHLFYKSLPSSANFPMQGTDLKPRLFSSYQDNNQEARVDTLEAGDTWVQGLPYDPGFMFTRKIPKSFLVIPLVCGLGKNINIYQVHHEHKLSLKKGFLSSPSRQVHQHPPLT